MHTESDKTGLRSVSATEARALLEEQEAGELSIAAFARDRGIHPCCQRGHSGRTSPVAPWSGALDIQCQFSGVR